jgi:diadenosine tetraphosphate (Ap4A) HIT family hydrolase
MTDVRDLSPFHARLPVGERMSAEPVQGDPFMPFEGELTVVPIQVPEVPEPPRNGEPGGGACFRCENPDRGDIWRDEHWRVVGPHEPIGLPMVLHIAPREHCTMHTMPAPVAAAMGPLIQRVAVAVGRIPGVARTHFARWGDGSEHFHLWFLARPLGMMQMRGAMLAIWDDLLPRLPEDEQRANTRTVAEALAEGGGELVEANL